MHVGVYQYAWASVWWLLVYDILPETPLENLRQVMRELREYWQRNPTPGHFTVITLSMFSTDNDPELSQPKLKGQAGEIKHLSKALLSVFKAHKTRGFVIHGQIALMMKKWIEMDDMLDAHPAHLFPKLPAAKAGEFETLAFDSLALLTSIADFYTKPPDPKALFNITIKAHYIGHCGLMARFVNPRLAICYGGEDYMKHMKRLVAATIRGTTASQISKKMCDKIRHAMHVEMTRETF